jgi:hypothetical protein
VDSKKLVVGFLLFASLAGAQTTDPVVTQDDKVAIRNLQHKMDQIVITSMQIAQQQATLQKQYDATAVELETAVTKAMVDSKVDGKDWTLDRENMVYKRNPTPPPAIARPEEKKKP